MSVFLITSKDKNNIFQIFFFTLQAGPFRVALFEKKIQKPLIFGILANSGISQNFTFFHIFEALCQSSRGEHTSNKISLVRGCNLRTELSQAQLNSTDSSPPS